MKTTTARHRFEMRDAPRRGRRSPGLALLGLVLLATLFAEPAEAAKKAAKKDRPAPAEDVKRIDAEGVYAMSMARGDSGLHIVEYWSRQGQMRAHTTLGGHPFVTLVTEDTYYTLDPVFKRGVAVPRSPRSTAATRGRHRLFGNEYEDMRAQGAEKIRSEQTSAGPVDVYRLTDDNGRRTVWVTGDEYRLPLKFETFIRATGETAQFEYLSWSPLRLTGEFFTVPGEGWDIERVPSYEAWVTADRNATFRQAPIIFPMLLHGRP